MELDLVWIITLLLTGLGAGTIDAIAGGGGLITLPVLLASGLSPIQALATNKLQGSFGTFAATLYFVRKRQVDLRAMRGMILSTFIGSAAGTLLVQHIDNSILAAIMPALLILIAIYFAFSPRIGDLDRERRISTALFTGAIASGIGFYDGFFGPGTGTFFTLAFVTLAGFGLARATAHTKVLNFTSNIASLLFFLFSGHIVWLAGLALAVGQLIGGQLGARLVVTRGTRLVRPLIVTVTLLMSAKLLLDHLGITLID
ncbi:putative membrane protein YfcA [Marinobacterium lacunae]|uniref:Probable membrane transporter protein n=1 Tax=Marinobacterium lacunae TaxID=1232683 RepID=A0A081G1X0_9GAMM|nr:putative membrane protein YfcA [Marinobacterium lacunae]